MFCFDVKIAYIGEFCGVTFKVFLDHDELPQWVWIDSVANCGFSSKAMNKGHN